MGNFGHVKSEVETVAIVHKRMAQAVKALFAWSARKPRAERYAWTLRANQRGLYLFVFILLMTPAVQGESAKVTIKEGEIPSESLQLVYQIALDQVSVSYAVQEVPRLEVYFVTNLQPERFASGRATRWTFHYPRENNQQDGHTVWVIQEAAIVMRKVGPWELWSESNDFSLFFTALVGALDYANQLYIDQKEMQTIRAAGISQWLCQTGRACDWRLLGNREKKMSFLKKRSSPP